MAGIFVKYWKPIRTSDGRIDKTADQILFPGSLQQFRQRFKGVCVIGYHNVDDDGVVLENSQVTLNEPYVMPPELAREAAAIEALSEPQNTTKIPQSVKEAVPQNFVQPQVQPQMFAQQVSVAEKIYESGDSFIKISGDKVYQLRWKEYQDAEAPFDQRVRVTADGESSRIEVTVWEELSPGEVKK